MKRIFFIVMIMMGCMCGLNTYAQPKNPVGEKVPKPIALYSDLYGTMGERIPPYDKWTKKQSELFDNEGFDFTNNMALAYTEKGMYGAIDENKTWIIKPVYYGIGKIIDFEDKLVAKTKAGWGIINFRGREIIPFKYDTIVPYLIYENLIVKKNGKYGMINIYDEKIIDFLYDSLVYENYIISKFNEIPIEKYTAAKKDGKWGFIDSVGKSLGAFEYEDVAGDFTNGYGIAGVKKDGKWGFINVDGKIIIPFKYARALGFDGESAWVSLTDREDDEGFYIDKDGNKVE